MPDHDPMSFARSLGAKLATRARHVCMFLGAGVGKACGLPDVEELQRLVLNDLGEEKTIALERQLTGRNLEDVISRLRRISALVSADETVDGLTARKAQELDASICQAIVKALRVDDVDPTAVRFLAAWAARANYRLPIELFTVNYDLLLETALESVGAPYFDGFVGALEARFHTELVEGMPRLDAEAMPQFFVRLWKGIISISHNFSFIP